MDEPQWLNGTDPEPMWGHLHDSKTSFRKLMLWACACLRRIWPLLTDERGRQAVVMAERNAEERVPDEEFFPVYWAACEGWGAVAEVAADGQYSNPLLRAMPDAGLATYHLIDADWQCVGNAAAAVASFAAPQNTAAWTEARARESKEQVRLLHCVFGNPSAPRRRSRRPSGRGTTATS